MEKKILAKTRESDSYASAFRKLQMLLVLEHHAVATISCAGVTHGTVPSPGTRRRWSLKLSHTSTTADAVQLWSAKASQTAVFEKTSGRCPRPVDLSCVTYLLDH